MWTLTKAALAALAAWLRITALMLPLKARRETREARSALIRKQAELRELLTELPPGSPEVAATVQRLDLVHRGLREADEELEDLRRILREYLIPVASAEAKAGGTMDAAAAPPAKEPATGGPSPAGAVPVQTLSPIPAHELRARLFPDSPSPVRGGGTDRPDSGSILAGILRQPPAGSGKTGPDSAAAS